MSKNRSSFAFTSSAWSAMSDVAVQSSACWIFATGCCADFYMAIVHVCPIRIKMPNPQRR